MAASTGYPDGEMTKKPSYDIRVKLIDISYRYDDTCVLDLDF